MGSIEHARNDRRPPDFRARSLSDEALRNGHMWDMQAPGYPAPLCEKCNVPKWVNWRFLSTRMPFAAAREGYECRVCALKKKRFGDQRSASEC
jgi:hypothetical protein